MNVLDQLLAVFNEADKGRLKAFVKAKGWASPSLIAQLFDQQRIAGLKQITGQEAGQRDVDLLALIVWLPFREDVLIGDDLEQQIRIAEALSSKAPTGASFEAAKKLFKHYTVMLDPMNAYRYFHLASRMGSGEFKPEAHWKRQYTALVTLLDDEDKRAIANHPREDRVAL